MVHMGFDVYFLVLVPITTIPPHIVIVEPSAFIMHIKSSFKTSESGRGIAGELRWLWSVRLISRLAT